MDVHKADLVNILAESPPPSESISNGHSNDLPVTASRVRRTDQARETPEEELKFAGKQNLQSLFGQGSLTHFP